MVKVGDKVKIIAETCGHGIPIGETRTIAVVNGEDDYLTDDGWAVGDDEIEIILLYNT